MPDRTRIIDTWHTELALAVRALDQNDPQLMADACTVLVAQAKADGYKLPGHGQIVRLAAAQGIPIEITPNLVNMMREIELLHES